MGLWNGFVGVVGLMNGFVEVGLRNGFSGFLGFGLSLNKKKYKRQLAGALGITRRTSSVLGGSRTRSILGGSE